MQFHPFFLLGYLAKNHFLSFRLYVAFFYLVNISTYTFFSVLVFHDTADDDRCLYSVQTNVGFGVRLIYP